MKLLLLMMLMAVITSCIYGQSVSDTGFVRQKQVIDSVTTSIDNNKLLTHILFTGELMYGTFKANCYYIVGTRFISKMECFFSDSAAGKKIIYYTENVPVQIVDKGLPYYIAGSNLFFNDGRPVKKYITKDMLFFCQEVNKMMLSVMD